MSILIRSIKSTKFTIPKRSKGVYKDTINQPKFPFSIHPSSELRTTVHWNEFFKKQCEYIERPTFILHDGPPYANGSLHMGHALNKFLKDVTIRHKILCGYRVNFVPGWDCHGLPIELKAACDMANPSANQIRTKASAVASHYVQSQKTSLISWGVLGDWAQSYTTMSPSYEANELNAFSELHSKNLIYRDLLPVYWSGQSRTALAESELEYNQEHISKSLYLKLRLKSAACRISPLIQKSSNAYAVIWTTTPWTLPANEAVLYNPCSKYVCLKAFPSGDLYLIGKSFMEPFSSMLPGQKLTVLDEFPGSRLEGVLYDHPLRNDPSSTMPFLPASHVVETVGTGLVHCAPCHGREDFEVACRFGLPLNSLVDESASFKSNVDQRLSGLSVIDEGNQKGFNVRFFIVLEMVESMTVSVDCIKHSYPFDWRTKTPIITRLSEQWFVDTKKLAESALESYQTVEVIPSSQKPSMLPFVVSRPRWCISRQRSWGVPIPVLFRITDNSPIVDYQFVKHIADRVAQSGTDFWFLESVRELVPEQFLSKWSISPDEITKSTDVFDVWFDSGLSWLCAMNRTLLKCLLIYRFGNFMEGLPGSAENEHVADLYLEGPDQFRGWFSASLLLSVALQHKAPYRKLAVHGFTADSEGRKMSKSLGNIVSPEQLIQEHKGCVDVLRRWAAFSGLDAVSSIGSKEIGQHASSYKMLRNSFRFLLGNLYDFDPVEQYYRLGGKHDVVPHTANELLLSLGRLVLNSEETNDGLSTLDLTVLCWLSHIVSLGLDHSYPNYRVYCDAADNPKRRAVQTVFWLTVECFKLLLAPILPYITEEVEEVCARQWSTDSPITQHPGSLLERLSNNTLRSTCSEPASSDWLICMNMMRDWERYHMCANAVELVHKLYRECIAVLESGHVTGLPEGPAVNLLSSSNVSIILSPNQSEIHTYMKMLHHDREIISNESILCHLFRCASIQWLVHDNSKMIKKCETVFSCPVSFHGMDLLIRLEPLPSDSRCPRCMRYSNCKTRTLCSRCTEVLRTRETKSEIVFYTTNL
ncbi:Isoleucine--tRNA ligase [Fasciola hepatica]|uniref:isoleucine--tRNA ligase n=1 Tax=Fasciola hepatica TaxID=6192 RepID=A0A4E0RDJ8_FASHE|nr:Isoleucine--tRNA ligase [Fasciola hepatica]